MGPFAYYSPFILGCIFALVMGDSLHDTFPTVTGLAWHGLRAASALVTGLLFQFILFGLQGVYAQVLPVPFGRSIRGGAAVATGGLSLLCAISFVATALLLSEGMLIGFLIAIIVGVASIIVAGLIYVWNLPAALRDFADDR